MAPVFKLKTNNIEGIATFGMLYDPLGQFICRTVEREWLNNEPSISCIPESIYDMVFLESPSKGMCIHLISDNASVTVAGPSVRTHCLFHSANWAKELQGCIAPGLKLNDSWGVQDSVAALAKLEESVLRWATHGDVKLDITRNI